MTKGNAKEKKRVTVIMMENVIGECVVSGVHQSRSGSPYLKLNTPTPRMPVSTAEGQEGRELNEHLGGN